MGMSEIQQSFAEAPTRLDEAVPGGLVDVARDGQTPRALKGLDHNRRPVAELAHAIGERGVADAGESLL